MPDCRRQGSPTERGGVVVVGLDRETTETLRESVGGVEPVVEVESVAAVEGGADVGSAADIESGADVGGGGRATDERPLVAAWEAVEGATVERTDQPVIAVGPNEDAPAAMAAGVTVYLPTETPAFDRRLADQVRRLADTTDEPARSGDGETGDTTGDAADVASDDDPSGDADGGGETTERTTEASRAEHQLAAERDRFQTLFDAFPEPVIAYRFEEGTTRVHRANAAFGETFGVDPAAAVGERVGDLVVPEEELPEAKRIDESVREYESVEREVTRAAADGPRQFRLQNVPRADDDTVDGFAIYADVTATKRRQRELERRNERLDEFASVVSHDLRNPLSVADGNVELATRMADDPAVVDRLESASDAVERMGTLIDDLLTVARRGAAVEDVQPVDLTELAPVAWQTADTAGTSLALADPPVVAADRGRVQQLLENLFRNAADHAHSTDEERDAPDAADAAVGADGTEETTDTADSGETDESGVTVTVGGLSDGFYVEDDGVGFRVGEPSDVFEAGVTTSEDGTGFGLRIVREICDAHGWAVTATDAATGGARFEITGVEFADAADD